MSNRNSKTGAVTVLIGLGLAITACGGKGEEAEATAGGVPADPHASLSVAADVMATKPPAGGAEAEAPAKR